ncbi:hypothetical protein F4814DRAFT_439344 [Daldinia grandis]|nr:hypothetical protein F4814DRAFT_439344 [Daldinia grandis]
MLASKASKTFEALKQALPSGSIWEPGAKEYEEVNSSYLCRLESNLEPAFNFQPKSKGEVGVFLKMIKPIDVKFAIRGAGIQPLPGSANIQGGVTLDLGRLIGVDINDGFLGASGLSITGSLSAIGGSLSFFSSREGFICGNVLNFEVVLASGEIPNANAINNKDLWRALKGAGNNLGIPYYTQAAENPPKLDPFTKVQPQINLLNTIRLHSVKNAVVKQSASGQDRVRCAKADLGTLNAASEIYTAELEPLKGPYPVSLIEQSTIHGINALGLNTAEAPIEDDNAVLAKMKSTLDKIKADATERDQLVPFIYMNYAFSHQDPLGPYGLFQKACPGGFKLFL